MLKRVINCKIHKERLKKFYEKTKKSNFHNVKRIDCINGKEFTDVILKQFISKKILNKNANLTPIEVAICLSHINCWKELVKSKSKYMIVFEDDARVYKSFTENLNKIMNVNLDFDILYLYNGNWMRTLSSRKQIDTINNIVISQETQDYNPSGTCYIITKKWAKELLKKVFPIIEPIDIFMGSVKVKSTRHYTLNNKRRKNDSPDCWTRSSLLYAGCPEESTSTQDYSVKTIKQRNL